MARALDLLQTFGLWKTNAQKSAGEREQEHHPAVDLDWLVRTLKNHTSATGHISRQDKWRLTQALGAGQPQGGILQAVGIAFQRLGIVQPAWRGAPQETFLPMLAFVPHSGFCVVYDVSPDGEWLLDLPNGRGRVANWPDGTAFTPLQAKERQPDFRTAKSLFNQVFFADRLWLLQAALASLIASSLALATSLYTMQVYDRVISTGGMSTLVVLSVGVLMSILIEFGVKVARSAIVNRATHSIDLDFANGVFSRMLGVRFDELPASVGTLAAQVRGFEVVRGFQTAAAMYLVSDAPFALFFLGIIFLLGGPYMALVPCVALIVAVLIGLSFKTAIRKHSKNETLVGNRRQGLLVEVINGVETLKGFGAGWKMLGRWNELSRKTIDETIEIKHLNDLAGFCAGWIQQVSYVGLIATGAWLATTGSDLTIGSIIACSILSGRVLTPINMLPGLMSQWGHAQVAMENLEKLFELDADNHNVPNPLTPEAVQGRVQFNDVEFAYPGMQPVVVVNQLRIKAGEKVAVLGTTGAGKSTFLRLCAGLVKPQRGHVLLDGMDLQQVSAERRAELVGYLPQRNTMFAGTLRDNLVLGLPAVDDETLLATVEATGLRNLIDSRPQGLDLPISEGGGGLSGGQVQLTALTRLILASPTVWLLDEPTAALDDASEARVIDLLRREIGEKQTLVLVTHKMRLLELVDRIVVLTPQGIALDGDRDAVIERLQNRASEAGQNAPANAEQDQVSSNGADNPGKTSALAG